jgi:hypothetical protein
MVSSASDTILLDTTAPAASMGVLPAFQRATSFVASWSATDGGSGVASYDVQRRSAGPSSAFSAYGNVLSATSATSTSISGPAGQTIGLRIRARDNAGNVSPWAYRVTALPVDDAVASVSGFTKSSGLTGQGYYLDTVSRSTTAGAKLTAPAATQGIKRVGVLVTKGPGFGSIEVRFNGVSLGTFSTANPSVAQRQVIVLPAFASAQPGTLRVRVASPGVRVVVDGLGLLRG